MKYFLASLTVCLYATYAIGQTLDANPRSLDPRLEIVQFAAAPDIVHPIAVDFDAKGRLLVVESHTHFRPKGYKGPEKDRIRIVEDTDGDDKADRFTTFFEGTKFTMDLAVHPHDGSVYVATRNEILRLRDTDGDGKADESTRLMFLETKGDYPHNGLSGLCFDSKGDFYFGLGENLGESYTLQGADGAVHKGGGEGGNIFWCTKDGKKLRRVATGFWNPFGICRDVFGRIFAVDNDPDSMPPCRLVHVVEGGDYGFQFRYGRAGRHPFQAWNGELPGTLPYVAGVGEAPCEVLAYESDGLPKDYLGTLLVTSWADHRLECYPLEERGASFKAKKKVVIQGDKDFRPVGLALAPDGSLFMSDWVRRDYNLHGQGALWHVRMKDFKPNDRPTDPAKAILNTDRQTREGGARKLATTAEGRATLRKSLFDSNPRIASASFLARAEVSADRDERSKATSKFTYLIDGDALFHSKTKDIDLLAMAASAKGVFFGFSEEYAAVSQRILLGALENRRDPVEFLQIRDPFIRNQVVRLLARDTSRISRRERFVNESLLVPPLDKAKWEFETVGLFLACRLANTPEDRALIPRFLKSSVEDIRFLTAKWIADDVIQEARGPLEKAMRDSALNSRLYLAYATALARLDGQLVNEDRLADSFIRRAKDEKASVASRVFALCMVPALFKGLQTEQLVKWTTEAAPEMRLEAVRALNDQTGPKRSAALLAIVKNTDIDAALRREAIVGLADKADAPLFLSLALDEAGAKTPFSGDALRGLVNVPLKDDDKARLETLGKSDPSLAPLIDRILGRPLRSKDALAADVGVWLTRLEGPAEADAGRRVFFHPRLAGCYRCHRVDGRGRDVGPDLSAIGQRERRFILESILYPSREVAPHFQTWQIETADGKVRTGLLWRTELDQTTYMDEKGQPFTVTATDVVEARPVPASIMPDGLVAQITDQELRDLLAFLGSRK